MNKEAVLQELYSEKDADIVKKYIKKHYGKIDSFYRDFSTSGIHPDIAIIPAKMSKPFFTLVTVGMGAHKTNIPPELADKCDERVELIITLDRSWKLEEKSEEWYWPLHMLRDAAKEAAEKDCCLGALQTVEFSKYYDEGNKFRGALLAEPEVDITEDLSSCLLSDGAKVKFLQFIPLFNSELKYKNEHGGEKLLKMLKENALDLVYSVNPERHSVV